MRQTMRLAVIAGLAAALQTGAAAAQELKKPGSFPERPITMIVPFGPGGGSDLMARAIATPMQRIMGVPIQVVNKPGGAGRAAIPDFMSAAADGYTLMQFSDDVLTLYAAGRITENPTVDWAPIGIGNVVFSQIYVRGDDDRFPDWDAFAKHAKSTRTTMANISHQGSMELVTMSAITEATGVNPDQISFDKPTERYAALVGQHVDSLFEQPSDVAGFIETKQMRPILTILRDRPEAFADVPSLTDIGVDWEPILRIRGVFVRAGVPEERKAYLEEVFRLAYEAPEFQKFLEQNYMTIVNSYRDRADSVKLIDSMMDTYRAAYKKLGLQ